MSRPTFSWSLIVKNESKNVNRLCDSIEGTWDELIVLDTGSTDDTIKLFQERGAKVYTFDWINDFSAARNECLKYITTDYWGWIDGDDVLNNKDSFIQFKDNLMASADMWLATYNYAHNSEGKPVCSFSRERVMRNSPAFKWKYFCHEGVEVGSGIKTQFAAAWKIDHQRTTEDLENDKGRNLKIFEYHGEPNLDPRMLYYYGKELFESGKIKEATAILLKANQSKDLEIHDRILCMQYAAYGLFGLDKFVQTIDLCSSGLMLDAVRAEFWVLCADSYLKQSKVNEAIPYLNAAKTCRRKDEGFSVIFQNKDAYGPYPRNQLARCYFHLQDFETAKKEIQECLELYPDNQEAKTLKSEIEASVNKIFGFKRAIDCDDIVISCPMNLYEWDEHIEANRGVGGSETAAIEMAKSLRKLSGRKIIIFNSIKEPKMFESGVQYMPADMMQDYFSQKRPSLHIAWRHNYKLTDAKTLLWSHDLITSHCQQIDVYDKYLCLSEFHKRHVMAATGIPEAKIAVTRNGIRPTLFSEVKQKNPNKFIWVSSLDRGLENAIAILEIVRINYPNIELHCFYGTQNMKTGGLNERADHYERLMNKHPWIVNHGNINQKELLTHYADASIWLYPTNFEETFCISALETAGMGVLPICRNYGALPNTLAKVSGSILVDMDAESFKDRLGWADTVKIAIEKRSWENVSMPSLESLSWDSVAREWLEKFLN